MTDVLPRLDFHSSEWKSSGQDARPRSAVDESRPVRVELHPGVAARGEKELDA